MGADGAISVRAREHAETCASCRVFFNERLALRRLINGLDAVPAPPDFEFRLRARLAAERPGRARRRGERFIPGFVSVGLAALFLLMAIAAISLKRTAPTEPALAHRGEDRTGEQAAEALPRSGAAPELGPTVATTVKSPVAAEGDSTVDVQVRRLTGARERASVGPGGRKEPWPGSAAPQRLAGRELARPARDAMQTDSLIAVPVLGDAAALRVLVPNGAEAAQMKIEPVSFGAQGPIGQPARLPLSSAQGIW